MENVAPVEQAVTEQAPIAHSVEHSTQETKQVATPEVDIIKRVSDFRKNQPQSQQTDNSFDYKELETIKDPVAKEIAIKAYKSMQAGLTRKSQELSETKKSLESKMQEMNAWTPERIQQLLRNPEFVQAAQSVVQTQNPPNSGLTDEQFSALTEADKAKFTAMERQLNQLHQTNLQNLINQTDEQLRSKYTSYSPELVNQGLKELSSMQPHQLREHIYRAKNYEADVKAAYELGLQESNSLNKQKINSISVNGNQGVIPGDKPVRQQNESDPAWFTRLGLWNISQLAKK